MNLSKQTNEVLKNFATINQGIIFKEGNVLRTMSIHRNIFAKAVVADHFPKEFAVYDLVEFMSTLSLFDQPALSFEDKFLGISKGREKGRYYYSAPKVVVAPPDKEIRMKQIDLSFRLTENELSQLQKAAGVMRLPDLVVTKNGVAAMNVASEGNQFEIDTEIKGDIPEDTPTVLKIDNLKLLPADYEVNISCGHIVQFKSATPGLNVEYFITVETE